MQHRKVAYEVDFTLVDCSGAGVAAGVQAPALCFDLRPGGDLAKAGDVDVRAVGEVLREQGVAI